MAEQQIKGVNGLVLIRHANETNDFRYLEDIYQGELSKDNPRAVHVPNVGDLVVDKSSGGMRWLEVQFVDETTMIPTMVEITNNANRNEFSTENTLLGIGPGYQSETWRLFLDQSESPFVFAVDSRLQTKGKEATKYKIFLGTDTSMITGKVISMNFDANGNLISEDLPLELVAFARTDTVDTNVSVKHPRKGFTTTKLKNGDVVTLVTYSEEGHPTSYNTLLVHNTALDRTVEASTRYITTIGLDSPFLDKTENNMLIFPMNIPRDALAMMGVVTYSDGSTKRIPVTLSESVGSESSRMVLSGLNNYVPMKKDQVINLVLTYHLAKGEQALNASTGRDNFVAVKYFGRTLQVDGSYSVNLIPIPTYVSDTYGWKMRYMLYTLDRDVCYDVTDLVENSSNTPVLNPLKYNEYQDITVAIDLQRVDPKMRAFRHVQSYKIALFGKPKTGTTTGWNILFEKDQEPPYGKEVICKAVHDKGLNRWRLDISAGCKNKEEWLEKLYFRSLPLTDKYSEARPPIPTHFVINIEDQRVTYPIRGWNQTIDFPIGQLDGYGVIIQWLLADGNKQYQLGCSPMCFIDISEGGVSSHASTTIIGDPTNTDVTASTIIDIDVEVQKIIDRGASDPIVEKYRQLLTRIKQYQLLKYEDINTIYQRIRSRDLTPASIANDVILLELEVNKITIGNFNRVTESNGIAPASMENQR